jgi:hypothetical protein
VPIGTETIMTSITQMATIATGRNNGDHNNITSVVRHK